MKILNSPRIVVELDGRLVGERIAEYLSVPGTTPVDAIESELERHIREEFSRKISHVSLRSPAVRLPPLYFKSRFANLQQLSKTGYDTWYIEILFSTRHEHEIPDITAIGSDISFEPITYGGGVEKKFIFRTTIQTTVTRHRFVINHITIPGRVFNNVVACLKLTTEQPYIANFTAGPGVQQYRFVAFDNLISGTRHFCRCAESAHAAILKEVKELKPLYVEGSWPHEIESLLANATYQDSVCHLCVARAEGTEAPHRLYGHNIYQYWSVYCDQVSRDIGVDEATAKAEVQRILGLSRWLRESNLYGVIREIFPEYQVLREASPAWLGRQRLDVFVPELCLAIEHQGEQHYRPVEVFGGNDGHVKAVQRDEQKRLLCKQNGVSLVEVRFDHPITLEALRRRLRRFLPSELSDA